MTYRRRERWKFIDVEIHVIVTFRLKGENDLFSDFRPFFEDLNILEVFETKDF